MSCPLSAETLSVLLVAMATSSKRGQRVTRLACLGLGAALGYTFYRKTYGSFSGPREAEKQRDALQLETSNVALPEDVDEYFSVALSAAYKAGETITTFINDKQSKSDAVSTKSNHTDLATQIDKECERIILGLLRSSFPSHRFIAEESCLDPNSHSITDEPTWFIDPIDGTTNFFHGLPFVAVCIGLRVNKVPVLGIVHCPILQETFHGILGRGAFVIQHRISNTIKLRTNPMPFQHAESMKQALVLTECGYERSQKGVASTTRRLQDLLYGQKVRAIRCLGSCAINMCWVAMGRADFFYEGRNNESGPKPWVCTMH